MWEDISFRQFETGFLIKELKYYKNNDVFFNYYECKCPDKPVNTFSGVINKNIPIDDIKIMEVDGVESIVLMPNKKYKVEKAIAPNRVFGN